MITAWLAALLLFVESSKYILLAIGSYVEGSGVMLTAGFFLHEGALAFWPTFIALYVGDLLSDLTLYVIGYFGARPLVLRWGRFLNVTPVVIDKVEERFHRYHTWILIISKLSMGFGFAYATLIVAGMLRVSFLRYVVINALGGLVWIPFMLFVGYTFGDVYSKIPGQFKIAFVVVVITGLILLVRYLSRWFATLR